MLNKDIKSYEELKTLDAPSLKKSILLMLDDNRYINTDETLDTIALVGKGFYTMLEREFLIQELFRFNKSITREK